MGLKSATIDDIASRLDGLAISTRGVAAHMEQHAGLDGLMTQYAGELFVASDMMRDWAKQIRLADLPAGHRLPAPVRMTGDDIEGDEATAVADELGRARPDSGPCCYERQGIDFPIEERPDCAGLNNDKGE